MIIRERRFREWPMLLVNLLLGAGGLAVGVQEKRVWLVVFGALWLPMAAFLIWDMVVNTGHLLLEPEGFRKVDHGRPWHLIAWDDLREVRVEGRKVYCHFGEEPEDYLLLQHLTQPSARVAELLLHYRDNPHARATLAVRGDR